MNDNIIEARTRRFREFAACEVSDESMSYRGIHEHAQEGLHAEVARVVQQHVAKGSRVLDIASGAGALAQRLSDLGYQLHAADYVSENFTPRNIPFKKVNLETSFSAEYADMFDAVIACEIIEHLENPRHFFREMRRLVRPNGKIILSTPNPDSPASHAVLLASGHFARFGDGSYLGQGHITPCSVRLLRQCAFENDLRIDEIRTWGSSWGLLVSLPRMKRYMGKLYTGLVALLDRTPRPLRGDITIAVFSNVA